MPARLSTFETQYSFNYSAEIREGSFRASETVVLEKPRFLAIMEIEGPCPLGDFMGNEWFIGLVNS